MTTYAMVHTYPLRLIYDNLISWHMHASSWVFQEVTGIRWGNKAL